MTKNSDAPAIEIKTEGVRLAATWAGKSLTELEKIYSGPKDYAKMAKIMFDEVPIPEPLIYEDKIESPNVIAAKRDKSKKGPLRNPSFTKEYEYGVEGNEIGIKLENGAVLKVGDEYIKNGWVMKYKGNGRADKLRPASMLR